MIWWQWIVLGAVLLASELFFDAEFYLIFVGVAAVAMGLIGLTPLQLPIWVQWILFAGLAAVSLVAFRSRFYAKIRGDMPELAEGVVGDWAVAEAEIGPGEIGSVQLRGTRWTARNAGGCALPAGARARVESVSGLQVTVRHEG